MTATGCAGPAPGTRAGQEAAISRARAWSNTQEPRGFTRRGHEGRAAAAAGANPGSPDTGGGPGGGPAPGPALPRGHRPR